MKHIKIFDTVGHLNQFKSSQNYIKPNVSLCEDNPTTVYYDPYVAPVTPAHDYVEIGGIKWATMNLGANSVTDAGLYFQWGDIQGYTPEQVGSGEGQKYFGLEDYKYYDSENEVYTKYNSTDELITLLSEDDAVTQAWGGNWRMPTNDEFQQLLDATTEKWTQINNVNGRLFTDKTDNSKTLFFPVGSCQNGKYYNGPRAHYWSSFKGLDDSNSNYFDFQQYTVATMANYEYRYVGCLIRGILDE